MITRFHVGSTFVLEIICGRKARFLLIQEVILPLSVQIYGKCTMLHQNPT